MRVLRGVVAGRPEAHRIRSTSRIRAGGLRPARADESSAGPPTSAPRCTAPAGGAIRVGVGARVGSVGAAALPGRRRQRDHRSRAIRIVTDSGLLPPNSS